MRMIAAIAPLCAAMPIFGRALVGRALDVELEGERRADIEAAHADAVRPEHRDIRGLRGGGQLFLLDAARIADLRVTRGEHDRGADAAPPQRRDRIDDHGLRNDQHRDIDAVRQFVDARHARRAR